MQIDTNEGSEQIKIKSNQINVYYKVQLQYDNKSIERGAPNPMRVYYTLLTNVMNELRFGVIKFIKLPYILLHL